MTSWADHEILRYRMISRKMQMMEKKKLATVLRSIGPHVGYDWTTPRVLIDGVDVTKVKFGLNDQC